MSKLYSIVSIILFSSCLFAQDSLKIVELYKSTDGQNWITNSNWLSTLPISEWYGITVNDDKVTAIELPRNNLIGQLPKGIGELEDLQLLNLADNKIDRKLPYTIKDLLNLQYLDLSHNQFSGKSIYLFDNLKSLILLDLSNNYFDGNIPKEIGKCSKLQKLDLSNNNFINNIPIDLFRLQNLTDLNLQNNLLSGSIPRQIGNCTSLQILDLSRNNLTGEIPKEIGNLTKLKERLALDHNELHGSIPKEISSLVNLEHMWLNNNSFSGILPFEIGKMIALKSLFIYQNDLVGPLPQTIGNLRDLQILFAQNNSFGGKIPQELWFLPKLKMLKLENNQLSGRIPGDLRILKSIQSIDLSNNRFIAIADSLSLPNSLLSFNVSDNNLFCSNYISEADSTALSFDDDFTSKIIGIDDQNCEEISISSFEIELEKIDFEYINTDSTAERNFWITSNIESNQLKISHFDKNNFYLSDSLITFDKDDSTSVTLYYSPIVSENHFNVLIIEDMANRQNKFITVTGEGVDSDLPDRDTSTPWKFKLHPIGFVEKSDTITIKYDVPEKSNINITIYNLGGRPIKIVHDGIAEAGFYDTIWEVTDDLGNPLEGGEYLCVMQAGMFIQIQPLLLLF